MKLFTFIAALVSMGVCFAGQPEKVQETKQCIARGGCCKPRKTGCCKHKKKGCCKPRKMPCNTNSVFGFALLQAGADPILVNEGDVLTSMTSRSALGISFQDGEFTVENPGSYMLGMMASVQATNGGAENSITVGVLVNGAVALTTDLTFVANPENSQYPAKFFGRGKMNISLNQGDKVCLKVIKVSLPEGASAYFAKEPQGRTGVAALFLRSKKQAEPQQEPQQA